MSDEEWIKTLEDGRRVKLIYQELPGKQGIQNPLSRQEVESRFASELFEKVVALYLVQSCERLQPARSG